VVVVDMPRKDRRFTGDDVRRIYCKNLTPFQRAVFEATDCDWSDYSTLEQAKKVVDFVADNDAIHELIGDFVPYGNYINLALDAISALLDGAVPSSAFTPVTDALDLYPVPTLPAP